MSNIPVSVAPVSEVYEKDMMTQFGHSSPNGLNIIDGLVVRLKTLNIEWLAHLSLFYQNTYELGHTLI